MIRRDEDCVYLTGICGVEEAETLRELIQAGARRIDWTGCARLHTSCLQVLLAASLPVCGTPELAGLTQFIAPLLAVED